ALGAPHVPEVVGVGSLTAAQAWLFGPGYHSYRAALRARVDTPPASFPTSEAVPDLARRLIDVLQGKNGRRVGISLLPWWWHGNAVDVEEVREVLVNQMAVLDEPWGAVPL